MPRTLYQTGDRACSWLPLQENFKILPKASGLPHLVVLLYTPSSESFLGLPQQELTSRSVLLNSL